MTKKLEQLLGLPASVSEDTTPQEAWDFIRDNQTVITEVDEAIGKIDAALPQVRDLDTGDSELDELADLAKQKANTELMVLDALRTFQRTTNATINRIIFEQEAKEEGGKKEFSRVTIILENDHEG